VNRSRPGGRAPTGVSLARALSKLGHCSRAAARPLVEAGRVTVDGRVVRDPDARVDVARAAIRVDGRAVAAEAPVYVMLNKPRGLVTTAADERGRGTVYACLEGAELPRVVAVGRLDMASEGLLLFTNDTRWAARVEDPASHLPKTYHVQIAAVPGDALAAALVAGVETGDAGRMAALDARVLRAGTRSGWLEVVLDEGRNRQIRRMLEALGHEVRRLVRVSIGPLPLGALAKGAHRRLTPAEKAAVDRALAAAAPPERPPGTRPEPRRNSPRRPS
jgi:23S rRNA pseudouridine2605 synthase